MRRVITYGTFDLFHKGHFNLLKRAKKLGDYLIVGVTTDNYDASRGKLNVQQDLIKRVENVRKSGLAEKIIIEEFEGQKILDIQRYSIDVFAIGSDWLGKFDYLKEYCDVVYLERTKGVSSTQLRNETNKIVSIGVVGYGRIAERFIKESKFVSGVNINGIYGPNKDKANEFCKKNELAFSSNQFDVFLKKIDAVYIASPHLSHYQYIKESLQNNKHVLCEKPMVLKSNEAIELYNLAEEKQLVLLEAVKTAFAPGFQRMVSLAKSGLIGNIKNVDATFTKLISGTPRELKASEAGGSMTELGTYPLLAAIRIFGHQYQDISFISYFDNNFSVDLFTRINIRYPSGIFSGKVGLGVKSEGDLVISGSKGYIYVPAPWWKTEYFEARFENSNENKKYYLKFDGDGLRYELAEFVKMINQKCLLNFRFTKDDSVKIIEIIELFRNNHNVQLI